MGWVQRPDVIYLDYASTSNAQVLDEHLTPPDQVARDHCWCREPDQEDSMLPSTVQRAVAAGLLLAYVSGCTSWRVQSVPAAQLFAGRAPDKVGVDRGDGTRVVLDRPHLSGDSIVGTVKGDTIGIPLQEARRISVRRGDALKTVGLTALIIGGVAAIAAATFTYSFDDPGGCGLFGCGEEDY